MSSSRGATEFSSMDEWLGHKTRGGGGNFLSGWKKKPGHCNTFMHVARLPMALWRHGFPTYVIVEDKNSKEKIKHVYPKRFTCHETEDVLKNPWRDKETHERDNPPQRCGLCKFSDWLWMQIVLWIDTHNWDIEKKLWTEKRKGKGQGINPCELLFDLQSEADDKESVKLYAGGICNFFGQKHLDDDVKSAMRKAKIRGDEAFKQNCNVKCEYVMCVVDNDDPGAGIQIAVETQALGEKVKEVIQKTYKSMKKNIQKTPYCIQWEYKEKEEFTKKYDATAMMEVTPSSRVLKLIRGEAPDLTALKECFNQQSMRSILERHCLLKEVPWDDIFPSPEQEKKWAKEDEAEASAEDEDEDDGEEESDDDDAEDSKSDADEDEDDMVKCDECGKPHKLSADKCPHCGYEYDVTKDDEDEEEEKPKAKSSKSTKSTKAPVKPKSKKKDEEEDEDEDEDEDEEEEEEKPKAKSKTSTPPKKKAAAKDDEDEDDEDEDDEDEDEDEEEEEKPKMKSRSEAAKTKTSTKKKAKPAEDDDDEDQGDDVPF